MRITGGELRSRTLRAPRGSLTRPTSDRVREAVFSMLTARGDLGDGRAPDVLDLYAGSGALAFEALSRGARTAHLVEQSRPALASIRENARALGLEARVRVVGSPVERAFDALDGRFGVIFCDPPYARVAALGEVLDAAARALEEGGVLVLEHAGSAATPDVEALGREVTRTFGDAAVSLYRRAR